MAVSLKLSFDWSAELSFRTGDEENRGGVTLTLGRATEDAKQNQLESDRLRQERLRLDREFAVTPRRTRGDF